MSVVRAVRYLELPEEVVKTGREIIKARWGRREKDIIIRSISCGGERVKEEGEGGGGEGGNSDLRNEANYYTICQA